MAEHDATSGGDPNILLIRGPIAVGKTTTVEQVANRMQRVAVVPVDWLRHMVGRWDPSDAAEAILASRNAGALARNFRDHGLSVLIDGPFAEQQTVDALKAEVSSCGLAIVTLWATWETVLARHQTRPPNNRADVERVRLVYDLIGASRDAIDGPWIDTTDMSPQDVVDSVLSARDNQGDGRDHGAHA